MTSLSCVMTTAQLEPKSVFPHACHYAPIIVVALLFLTCPVIADVFFPPASFEVYSENGRYVASVVPGRNDHDIKEIGLKKRTNALLTVHRVAGKERHIEWHCRLVNEVCPLEARISNDGRTVVILDDYQDRGSGENIIVTYDRNGLLKNYSLERAFGVKEEDIKAPSTVSSRLWQVGSFDFFMPTEKEKQYFCLWINWPPRWAIFDAATGELVNPTPELISRVTQRARANAIAILEAKKVGSVTETAIIQLGHIQKATDRPLLESQLKSRSFCGLPVFRSSGDRTREFTHVGISSRVRLLTDSVLSKWDGLTKEIWIDPFREDDYRYVFLGSVSGTIHLLTKEDVGSVSLYLIPDSVKSSAWMSTKLDHVVQINRDYTVLPQDIPFQWRGVYPGNYWIKVIWNRNVEADGSRPPGEITRIQTGDYESINSNVFHVSKRISTNLGVIECTTKAK